VVDGEPGRQGTGRAGTAPAKDGEPRQEGERQVATEALRLHGHGFEPLAAGL